MTTFHLGDRWARLNCALRLLEQGNQFSIYLPDKFSTDILELLDLGLLQPHIVTSRSPDEPYSKPLIRHIDTEDTAYRCAYFPTKLRHRPRANAIGYSFSASWRADEKIPPDAGEILRMLKASLPGFEFVAMGRPHQADVTALVRALAGVRLLLSVDNGVAHVARSVGLPLFLLEHQWPVARGFPADACGYTKLTSETAAAEILKKLRGEANGTAQPSEGACSRLSSS